MIVKPCPKCGRKPIIKECMSSKDGVRRRMCLAKCYHSCLSTDTIYSNKSVEQNIYHFAYKTTPFFVFLGEGDDNNIYKIWNEALVDDGEFSQLY